MSTVQEIYLKYKISSSLQLHQLRVAAVAKKICDNFDGEIDQQSIIFACLFHDMGNIIKSDLTRFPEFLKPEGHEYWKKVKDEYNAKYGNNEHLATEAIAKEINLSPKIIAYIRKIGFSNATRNEKEAHFEDKICNYSDMRVDPNGVTSMKERILEGQKRYAGKKHSIASDSFESLVKSFENIEKQIFSKTKIKPSDITKEGISKIIEEFRNLNI